MDEELNCRVATRDDLVRALKLLDENQRASLTEADLKDGFISVKFTIKDLEEMSDNGITIVSVSSDTIAGVLSAQTCDYNLRTIPLVAEMLKTLDGELFDGRPINHHSAIICGPVCVSKEFRGLGVMEHMYDTLKNEARTDYSIGLTLISQGNPRSLRAHEKIGMRKITSFEFDGRTFDSLAMRLDQ